MSHVNCQLCKTSNTEQLRTEVQKSYVQYIDIYMKIGNELWSKDLLSLLLNPEYKLYILICTSCNH